MRQGLRDPNRLTNEEKGVMLFLAAIGLTTAILLVTFALALFWREALPLYKEVLYNAGANVITAMGVPIPAEVLLILSVASLGGFVAFTSSFAGRMVGVWLVYLLGDSLNHEIHKKTKNSPRMKRAVDWMNNNAEKRGFWILILINALPLIPDVLLYVFAVSGMKFRKYMGGIAVGTIIKFGATVAAVYWIGPDRVTEFAEHPIAHIVGLFG
jgi:uncharacterized membrane protein YdjX (TVP38/TMEM64 family)